ncbi:MAG: DUF5615 family PIN-like protein [Cyclobacteriaceae bacterium]
MRFLIDENLPPVLASLFRDHGLEAFHINEANIKKPVKDDGIRRFSLRYDDAVIISRDDDFVKSYVSRKVPHHLIYVFDLTSRSEIISAFEKHLDELIFLMKSNELVELNAEGIKKHF